MNNVQEKIQNSSSIKTYDYSKSNHLYAVDTLRTFAALAIILLHTVSTWHDDETYGYLYYEMSGVQQVFNVEIVSLLVRWAVPVFFMISGMLLLDPNREMPLSKIKNHVIQLGSALLLFGYLYSLIQIVFENRNFQPIYLLTGFKNILEGNTWRHLWYLYALLGLYAILPILRSWIKNVRLNELCIVTAVLFILLSVIPSINVLLGSNITTLGITDMRGAIINFLLGYVLIYIYKNINIKNRTIAIITIFGGGVLTILEAYGFQIGKEFSLPYYVWTIAYASGIFILAMRSGIFEKLGKTKLIQEFSKCSFCIYIIHPIGIHILYKVFNLFPYKFVPVFGTIAIWIVVSLLSFIGAMIMRRLPVLKKIL